MVPCSVLSRTNLANLFARPSSKPRYFNSLPPLEISCLSFSDRRSLFSIACSLPAGLLAGLFLQNTRGGIPAREAQVRSQSAVHLPLESTLAKVYQNKQLQLPLESTLMQKPGEGEVIVN